MRALQCISVAHPWAADECADTEGDTVGLNKVDCFIGVLWHVNT
jgi:hypothetical protein